MRPILNFRFIDFINPKSNKFFNNKGWPVIKKECFKLLFENINDDLNKQNADFNKNFLGLGNPDADILFVSTKLLLTEKQIENWRINRSTYNLQSFDTVQRSDLLFEEYDNNFFKWYLVQLGIYGINSHSNPLNPLLNFEVHENVLCNNNHIYFGIQRLINLFEERNRLNKTYLAEKNNWEDCTFYRFFFTGLNIATPDADFKVNNFVGTDDSKTPSARYNFMSNKDKGFYKSFKTVFLFLAGNDSNTIGDLESIERERLLKIFNPDLKNSDIKTYAGITYYDCGEGARVIISPDFTNGFNRIMETKLVKLIK